MVPEHSPIRDFEAERDLTSNLVELSGSVVTVFLGNESYRGILGIEVNEDFSEMRMVVAIDRDYSKIERTNLPRIAEIDLQKRSVQLKNYGNGGAGQ